MLSAEELSSFWTHNCPLLSLHPHYRTIWLQGGKQRKMMDAGLFVSLPTSGLTLPFPAESGFDFKWAGEKYNSIKHSLCSFQVKLQVTSVWFHNVKAYIFIAGVREVLRTSQGLTVTEVSPFSVYDSGRMRRLRLSYHANNRVPCSQWADFIGLYYRVRVHAVVAVCVWLGNKPSVTVTFIRRNSLSFSHTLPLVLALSHFSLSRAAWEQTTLEEGGRNQTAPITEQNRGSFSFQWKYEKPEFV